MANKFGMVFEDYTNGVFVYNENNNHYLGQIKGKTSNEVSKMRNGKIKRLLKKNNK